MFDIGIPQFPLKCKTSHLEYRIIKNATSCRYKIQKRFWYFWWLDYLEAMGSVPDYAAIRWFDSLQEARSEVAAIKTRNLKKVKQNCIVEYL